MKSGLKTKRRWVRVAATVFALGATAWSGSQTASANGRGDKALDRGRPYIVAAGRSPIPQAGERFKRPLPFKRLVDEEAPGVGVEAPGGVIAWGAAHRYVGQRITVEGQIVNTHNHRGQICFLNFDRNWRDKFYIPVFDQVFADLPEPPEDYFLNKTIRVTGTVTLHRNRPNIEVQSIGQIQVVE